MSVRFYFAWADEGEAFSETAHAVEDEGLFSFALSQTEGEFATLLITLLNPRAGLLNGDHPIWCWFSYEDEENPTVAGVTPLFNGRLVGVPSNIQDEAVELTFLARPEDYDAQKSALAETLKVAPYWDPIFVPTDRREDPDFVLESRPERWHIDRVTLAVTASDIVEGEDDVIAFGSGPFYDSVKITYDQAPATRFDCKATITWVQRGNGMLDLSGAIEEAFAAQGGSMVRGFLATYTGGGLISDWPPLGTDIGGGWKVGTSSATRIDGRFSKIWLTNVAMASGGLASTNGATFAGTGATTTGGLLGFYGASLSDTGGPSVVQFPIWNIQGIFFAEYEASRERVETVTFSINADVQPIVSDTADDVINIELTTAEVDQPVDPGGAIPILDLRRPSYMLTDRGKQSLGYLITRGRSALLARARCVRINFEDTFQSVVRATLRKSATIVDPRIPGGSAKGKITGYNLSLDGDSGAIKGGVVLACTIGRNNTLVAEDSENTYVVDGYVAVGWQALVGGATAIAGDVQYEDYDTTVIVSDGIDLLNLTPADCIDVITVANGLNAQRALLLGTRTPGTGTGYLVNHVGGYPVGATSIAVDSGTGTILAGDLVQIGFSAAAQVASSSLSGGAGTLTLAAPGLRGFVTDNAPVTISRVPQKWTDTQEAIEALNALHTRVVVSLKPISGADPLESTFAITVSDLMVPLTIDLEAA